MKSPKADVPTEVAAWRATGGQLRHSGSARAKLRSVTQVPGQGHEEADAMAAAEQFYFLQGLARRPLRSERAPSAVSVGVADAPASLGDPGCDDNGQALLGAVDAKVQAHLDEFRKKPRCLGQWGLY